MKSLVKSRETEVAAAYVICLHSNHISLELAQRCVDSCERVGQNAVLWPAFDGTGTQIQTPPQLRDQSWPAWIKLMDHFQSPTEIACSLSHISLWVRCMELDQPIIVLEHDAVMTQRLHHHRFYNSVQYLGCAEQTDFDLSRGDPVPMSAINENWLFINRAHAYSIDPPAARRLFGMVLDRGIFESLDVMIMADAVAIIQDGIYARDQHNGVSTITDRKKTGQHGPGQIKI